jgi:uncharacterized protein (TIGR02145 family)
MSVEATLTGIYETSVKTSDYGLLYNNHVVTDIRGIAGLNWRVPTYDDVDALRTELGGITFGGDAKEVSSVYWTSPNTSATNSSGFSARGGGYRNYSTGAFSSLTELGTFRCSTVYASNYTYYYQFAYDNGSFYIAGAHENMGTSIRLIKESTILSDGETSYYIGNDGKIYNTICIGTQEWMSQNLAETLYSNLDPISIVTDGGIWSVLTTGALCVYNNDWNNL